MTIMAYKHNQIYYRHWESFILLEETKEYFLLVSNYAILYEKNKTRKITDKIIWILFKEKWYNIMFYFSKTNEFIQYYCNIASPAKSEKNIIGYIDYDLDIKVKVPNYNYQICDLKEFNLNRIKYNYGNEVINNCWKAVNELKNLIVNKQSFFDENKIMEYLNLLK